MTERLYQLDSYVTEFDAVVVNKKPVGKQIGLILDHTYFYPTAGGQQSDRGTVDNKIIIDVREEGDEIIHVVEEEPACEKVHCNVDWSRRFSFMQQHTGQHMLSQCFVEFENAPTISAHMGEIRNTLDLGIAVLDWDILNKVEKYANEIVMKMLPINIHFYESIQECPFNLRKQPVVERKMRVVEISTFDANACGGTHCRNTGEVGVIKVLSYEKYKGGYRIEFLCGERALKDYHSKIITISALRNELNSKEEELVAAAQRMKESDRIRKKELDNASWNYIELLCENLMYFYTTNPVEVIVKEFDNYSVDKLKRLASMLTEKISSSVILLGHQEQLNIVITRPKSCTINLKEKCIPVLAAYQWRGGGSDSMLIGALPKGTIVSQLVKELEECLGVGDSEAGR